MKVTRQFAIAAAFMGLALAGCSERPMSVPASASLMTDGQGTVAFRPTEHGRVYVTDQTQDKILYQAEVDKDQMVELNAQADQIRVSGRTVSETTLDDGHRYRIFFEPLPEARVIRYREVERVEPRP